MEADPNFIQLILRNRFSRIENTHSITILFRFDAVNLNSLFSRGMGYGIDHIIVQHGRELFHISIAAVCFRDICLDSDPIFIEEQAASIEKFSGQLADGEWLFMQLVSAGLIAGDSSSSSPFGSYAGFPP